MPGIPRLQLHLNVCFCFQGNHSLSNPHQRAEDLAMLLEFGANPDGLTEGTFAVKVNSMHSAMIFSVSCFSVVHNHPELQVGCYLISAHHWHSEVLSPDRGPNEKDTTEITPQRTSDRKSTQSEEICSFTMKCQKKVLRPFRGCKPGWPYGVMHELSSLWHENTDLPSTLCRVSQHRSSSQTVTPAVRLLC